MAALDLFRVAIRWLHLLAGVTWVGGSLFYVLVLGPAARDAQGEGLPATLAGVDRRFRELVQLAIAVLIVTGALLSFDRLQLQPGPAYAITLGIKIALAVWMFVLAQDIANRGRRRLLERRRGQPTTPRGASTNFILGLGLAILLLSDVLKVIGPP